MKDNNPLVSIIIPTYNRADMLKQCLHHLEKLTYKNFEVLISDASTNNETEKLVKNSTLKIKYFKMPPNRRGYVKQSSSVLGEAVGSIIAQTDDDGMVYPDWLSNIVKTYDLANDIGGVGGRTLRGDEVYWDGKTPIGSVRSDGYLTDGFDGDPGKIIDVDHLIGCNMSYKKDVLDKIGGWDEWYDCERSETDIAIRVKKAGYRILFNPDAVVDHIGAPRVDIRRFSLKYTYHTERNHIYMLIKNYGFFSMIFFRYCIKSFAKDLYIMMGRIAKGVLVFTLSIISRITGCISGVKASCQK